MGLGKAVKSDPAGTFAAITPSDSVNLAPAGCGLYVGGGGDIVVVGLDDVSVTFVGVPTGTVLPIMYRRINSTNTTATNLVRLS